MLLESWYQRDVRPELSCAMRRRVLEEVAPCCAVQKVIGDHTCPRVGDTRVPKCRLKKANKENIRHPPSQSFVRFRYDRP